MFSIQKKIRISLSKNLPELFALKNKSYPTFVYESNPKTLKDEIPVFTLHSVYGDKFEEQLKFLYKNSYQTLKADELYDCITGSKPIPERAIVLTFDDGWKNLQTVTYSILKKYEMCAVCFLIPGLIPTESGNKETGKMGERGLDSETLCSWKDINEMHISGVIDFQSHSMYHKLIYISSVVEDFFYPSFNAFAMNLNVPLFRIDGEENISRRAELGTPIYKHASSFAGKNRYFDDENLRNECTQYVRLNGGEEFFKKNNWRKKLFSLVEKYKMKYGESGYFENEEILRESLFIEFRESKQMIEKNLYGKIVNHFCYPWWEGSDLALEISKQAGYLTNFWGILSDRRTNRYGDDPYRIARLLSDDYIFRLPGEGRKSFLKVIQEKISSNYSRFSNQLVQKD